MQMLQSKQNQMTIVLLNTLFHPAISSLSPALQVCVLPTFTSWRPCMLHFLDSLPSLFPTATRTLSSKQWLSFVQNHEREPSEMELEGWHLSDRSARTRAFRVQPSSNFNSPAFLHTEGLPCLTRLLTWRLLFPPLLLWPEAQT